MLFFETYKALFTLAVNQYQYLNQPWRRNIY